MQAISTERRRQRKTYEDFIYTNIKMSKKFHRYEDLVEYSKKFDAVVCGSDQIWNPYYWGKDSVYYASFVSENQRISYAASIGTIDIDDNSLTLISSKIRHMRAISVREESAAQMLKERAGINAKVVVDPTFLMTREWWNTYSALPLQEQDYILTFFFDNSLGCREFAKRLGEKYRIKLINIPETSSDVKSTIDKWSNLGPHEFASAFRNAKYIVTQSFHGVVLSILYRKEFFVLDRTTEFAVSGLMSRITDMLKRFGLEDRIIQGTENLNDIDRAIDYEKVYMKIDQYAEEGRRFLIEALEEVTNEVKQ